jgi:protein-L-isoaspartate O-methyltransferase
VRLKALAQAAIPTSLKLVIRGYLIANKEAYDPTAKEFQDKKALRQAGTVELVDFFLNAPLREFPTKECSILELGPGSGYASKLMSEIGHDVTRYVI